MKTYLTGMPECQFGMNDKISMEREAESKRDARRQPAKSKRQTPGIGLDDCTFHRCVRLGKFDSDRVISFIPPDGEFDLMKYRISQSINLPFQVIPIVSEHGRSRIEYEVKIKGNFSAKLSATNVILRIPCPKHTSKTNVKVGSGKCKYDPNLSCLVWKLGKFPGTASYVLRGEVHLVALIKDVAWSRPPITMDFQVPMYTSSGLHVRFLKVNEKNNYHTVKWVRYVTRAGTYQIRI
uniref:Adaptor protein complex 2 subunit mu n=2 Tax=Hirondellea gigas TaxID=1518452 RepID=A0A2P2HVU5_9CRUS